VDPITTAIILSWVEVKSVCESLVKHPDNDDEKAVAEHILMVMARHMQEAQPGSRTPARAVRQETCLKCDGPFQPDSCFCGR